MKLTLYFLSGHFPTWPKKSEQNFKHLQNEKSLLGEIAKNIFHYFKRLSVARNRLRSGSGPLSKSSNQSLLLPSFKPFLNDISLLSLESYRNSTNPAKIFLFKANDGNTRTICEICSKLTIRTPQQRHLRRSGVSIVDGEQVNTRWE